MRITRKALSVVLIAVLASSGVTSIGTAAPRRQRFSDVVSRTRIPFQPLAIADGFGSIWVATDLGVSEVNPDTGEIVAHVSVGAVGSVATGRTGVFISSYANDRVARVDPSTNEILWSTEVPGPLRLALGAGALWAWSPVVGTLSRIAPSDGDVDATITIDRHVPAAVGVGGEPDDHGFATGLAVGAGSVWVGSRVSGRLVRVDPSTDRVVARIHTRGSNPYGIAVGGGVVWVTDYGTDTNGYVDATLLSGVDPSTQRIRSYPLHDYGNQVVVSDGSVWVSTLHGLLRLDPHHGRLTRMMVAGLPPFPSFGLWAIAAGSGRVWAATMSFELGVDEVLYQIDPERSRHGPSLPRIIEPTPGILPVSISQGVPMTSGHLCSVPGPDCRQFADVYAPSGPGTHPVVVLAHEYCGQAGCKRYLDLLAAVLSVDGAVVFNAEFGDPQNGNSHGWLKTRDLACAIRFARSRAASYGGDPSRVTLVSHLSASWSAATVALDGDAHVGDDCLATEGSASPDAFVGIADAPNQGHTPELGGNPDLRVRMIIGSRDAAVVPAAFRRVNEFVGALTLAGYDATLTIARHGAFAWSPATHSNIDVGSSYPTIRTILDVAT